jgi:hypothetical protein
MLTVVTPLYQKGPWIDETIAGALAQSMADFTMIVVDDGSTDDGPERVMRAADPRIRLVRQDNQGVAAARSRGLDLSETEYVAFLDADDVWRPHHLRHLVALAERFPDAVLLGNDFVDAGAPAGDGPVRYRRLDDFFDVMAAGRQPFFTSSCMVRRDAARAAGGFPHGHSRGEDLALWIRLAADHSVAVSDYVGCFYHRSTSGLTARVQTEPDIAMKTLARLAAEPGRPAAQAAAMAEYRNRLAIAHARDCLAAGEIAAARRFLSSSAGTRRLAGARRSTALLAALPAPLRRLAFAARDARQRGLR